MIGPIAQVFNCECGAQFSISAGGGEPDSLACPACGKDYTAAGPIQQIYFRLNCPDCGEATLVCLVPAKRQTTTICRECKKEYSLFGEVVA